MRTLRPLAALAFAVLAAAPARAAAPEVRAHSVGLMELDAAVQLVRSLLSPEGVAVEDRRNHRVIVSDRPEVHARVAAALRGLDTPARNVRIRVTHESERLDERTLLGGSAGVGVGDVRVGVGRNPPRSGVDVRGEASRSRSTSKTQQEIVVTSGGKAHITVAEQVPYSDWFLDWGQGRGLWARTVQWRDVGASLVVEPVALGDGRVRVRLTPAFSYFLDRERLVTEIHQLTTDVVVREGEPIALGGVPMSDTEFRERFLVGFDRGRTLQRVHITLLATVD